MSIKDCKTTGDLSYSAIFSIVLSSLTLFSGALLSSPISFADDTVVDDVTITVPVACTLSGTGMTTHNATITNGTYQANIGTTTLKAFCNDSEGFAIYAAGYTGNTIGETNSNKLVGTSASGNATIVTGTATSAGNPDISNWAMKLTASTGANVNYPITLDNGFGSYSSVPNAYTKVAHRDSGTDVGTNAEGSTLTTTYAAYMSKTQAADTYSGQVIYTLVHPADADAPPSPQPATAGCINYFANVSNAVGTMGCQSATDSTETTLLASNFSRTGYGFAGWSDAYDYATNANAHFYGPQETITTPADVSTNGLSLYAVWVPSAGSLQDSTKVSQLCGTGSGSLTQAPTDGTANLSSVSALTDQRDNQTYAIAKLADGKCWMIENLRLESTAAHNSDGSLAQGYGTSTTYGNFEGLADAETEEIFYTTYVANSLYSIDGSNGTINIDTSNYPAYRMPRYNNINTPTNTSDRPHDPATNWATNSTSNAGMYSYGNYYTWSAAIADTTAYSNGNHNTTSICPGGWQIPLGNISTGDINQGANDSANRVPGFSYLDRKMGGTGQTQGTTADSLRWRKYPVNFVYSGYISASGTTGRISSRGTNCNYTSSTVANIRSVYQFSMSKNDVYPASTYGQNKYYGATIRCVASGA